MPASRAAARSSGEVGMKINRCGDLAEGGPHLAALCKEVVVGVDEESAVLPLG